MGHLQEQVIAAVQEEQSDAGRVIGRSLRSLRKMIGLTQEQMAHRLGVGQATVSKIEHRGDVQISSLQRYVEALGARLKVEAMFPRNPEIPLHLKELSNAPAADGRQLVLPLFDDDVARPHRDVVISIHPRYSEKILDGKKTVELRRRFPVSAPKGAIAFIYSTSPVQAIVGSAEITDVLKLPVQKIWDQYSARALITRNDFDTYFTGLEEGFALEFSNVKPLRRAFDLSELRERFGFKPPQSFLYARPELRRALQDEYSNVSH